MALDPSSGLPLDPMVLQQLQEQQLMGAGGRGNAAPNYNAQAIAQASSALFPSPEVQKARQVQSAMQQTTLQQGAGESELDFSMRQLQAQRDAVASIDPNAAAQMNTQLLKLSQMKIEQSHLLASDQREAANFEAKAGDRARDAAVGGLSYAILPDPKADLGYRILGSYDATDPAQTQAMLDTRSKNPGALIVSADRAAQLFNSSNTADMKLAGEMARAAGGANGPLPAEAVPGMAVQSVFDPTIMSRMNGQQKAQLQTALLQAGVLPADQAGAKLEYKALQAAAGQTGRREGNIAILQNEVGGMGDQVTQSLQGLTRTDFAPLNQLIMSGKQAFSDPGEARYAAAVQSFVTTYARVIAGGTGQSTEGARKEAWAALNKAQGPEGIQAAIQQLAVRELNIVATSSDMAREMIARPDNYKSIWKIQNKMGMRSPMQSDAGLAVTQPQDQGPPPAAGPQTYATEADVPANIPVGTKIIVGGKPATIH